MSEHELDKLCGTMFSLRQLKEKLDRLDDDVSDTESMLGWSQPTKGEDKPKSKEIALDRARRGWKNRLIDLRSDLLAALLESQSYDELYSRGMDLLDEYDVGALEPQPPEEPEV